jgi:hypothetical protein
MYVHIFVADDELRVERLYKGDCEYFLLTEDDTCGLVFND